MKYFVVTNPSLGWRCVVGLIEAKGKRAAEKFYQETYQRTDEDMDQLVFHEQQLEGPDKKEN